MKVGLQLPFTSHSPHPAAFARTAEALGFDSFWVPEHPIFPVDAKTPFPLTNGPAPEIYSHLCDPFVVLSMAATATTRLKVATGICLLPERNPILTAKTVATLDALSDGRFIFGIGAGWLREESELLGVDFPRRWSQTAQYIAAMRELWSKDEASFEGHYVKFSPVRCNPKPVQQSGPPILIGSLDKNALKRVAKWADGWCPNRMPHEYVKSKVDQLRRECDAVGRDFSRFDISAFGLIEGDRSTVQTGLQDYRNAGATRFVVGLRYQLTPTNYEGELQHLASLYL